MSDKKDPSDDKDHQSSSEPPASSSSSTESNNESEEPGTSNNVASVKPQASSSSSSSLHLNGRVNGRPSSPCSSKSFGRFHKNEKFVPKEDLVKQIMDMGICRNGAVKALYWTGNQSALAASNWIFDQPDRDLDTPLEDELEMIRAQQAEREREDLEEREFASHMCRVHHHHHHLLHDDDLDEDDIDEEDLMEEEEDDEDDEDEDIEDEEDEDMEFKMVFVVNKSLELKSGIMSLYVAKATAGLFRKINSQPQSVLVGPDELSMWGDLGEKMIVLSGENDQHMKDLELMAKNLRLPCHMIDILLVKSLYFFTSPFFDIYEYFFQESNSKKAVLGIFGEEREVNKVTGRLKIVT